MVYEVYSRKEPYEGEDPAEVLQLVTDRATNKRPPVPKGCPAQIQSLLIDCLGADPEQRPNFEEINTRLKRMDSKMVQTSQNAVRSPTVSLFDIFPRHIAEALRDGRQVDSEHKDCVTIFFSGKALLVKSTSGFVTFSRQPLIHFCLPVNFNRYHWIYNIVIQTSSKEGGQPVGSSLHSFR